MQAARKESLYSVLISQMQCECASPSSISRSEEKNKNKCSNEQIYIAKIIANYYYSHVFLSLPYLLSSFFRKQQNFAYTLYPRRRKITDDIESIISKSCTLYTYINKLPAHNKTPQVLEQVQHLNCNVWMENQRSAIHLTRSFMYIANNSPRTNFKLNIYVVQINILLLFSRAYIHPYLG